MLACLFYVINFCKIMLHQTIEKALNEQIVKEAYASFSYLSMATWCAFNSLEGAAKFFYRQSDEERLHMMKLIEYMIEMDVRPIVPAVEQAPIEYRSIQEIFNITLAQEESVTRSIHNMLQLAIDSNDFATQNFLQWYVTEQREEESMIRRVQDKIRLIGEGPQSLYYIDKELEKINQQIQASSTSAV